MPKGAMMYDPAKVKAFKILIGRIAKQQMTDNNYKRFENVPLKMNVWFFRPLQKSLSKKEREKRIKHEHLPIAKPDTSNYIKSFEDALNGIVWKDDSQITDIHAYKRYSENPRIELEIEAIESEKKD